MMLNYHGHENDYPTPREVVDTARAWLKNEGLSLVIEGDRQLVEGATVLVKSYDGGQMTEEELDNLSQDSDYPKEDPNVN